jgi:hypothetical protein
VAFVITVTARHHFFAFKLRVDYLVGSRPHSLTLTNQGKPFELSAFNCVRKNRMSYGYAYEYSFGTKSGLRYTAMKHPSRIPACYT